MSAEFLDSDARALIALQGPQAATALEDVSSLSLRDLYFMQTRIGTVAGVEGCRITRCGYTGWCHFFFLEIHYLRFRHSLNSAVPFMCFIYVFIFA